MTARGSLDKINLLLVHPHGRAGSLFLQSLFDGHPEIVTLPHFGPIYTTLPKSITDAVACLDGFIHRTPALFDSSRGYFGESGISVAGAFGPNFDEHLIVDSGEFRAAFLEERARRCGPAPVARADFFKMLHLAYARTVRGGGGLSRVKYILYHPHKYGEFDCLLAEHPTMCYIAMTRDPRQDWESWRKVLALRTGTAIGSLAPLHLLNTMALYSDDVANLTRVAREIGLPRLRIVDLNRLHSLNRRGMESLCGWLGVAFHECLLESTFNGRLWAGNAATREKIATFNPRTSGYTWRERLGSSEAQIISQTLGAAISWLRYEQIEIDPLVDVARWLEGAVGPLGFMQYMRQSLRQAPVGSDQTFLPRARAIVQVGWSELCAFCMGSYRRRIEHMRMAQEEIARQPVAAEAFL